MESILYRGKFNTADFDSLKQQFAEKGCSIVESDAGIVILGPKNLDEYVRDKMTTFLATQVLKKDMSQN